MGTVALVNKARAYALLPIDMKTWGRITPDMVLWQSADVFYKINFNLWLYCYIYYTALYGLPNVISIIHFLHFNMAFNLEEETRNNLD